MPPVLRRLFDPVDIASVAALRVMFGLVMLVAMLRMFARGFIDQLYVQPAYLFPYWGFEWLPRLPPAGFYALFAALAGLCLLIAVGLYYRTAVALLLVGFGYVELLDRSTYLNHYYFVSIVTLLMLVMPLHGALSLDARRRPALRRTTVPAWVPWALRLQLGLVYLYAGVAKLDADWLLHAQPLRIWLEARADLWWAGPWLAHDAMAYAMAWGGALFDLTIFGWLCWKRTRRGAYAAVVGFHLVTGALFPIGMFPWIMIAATTVFFDPSWPRGLVPRHWWGPPPEPRPEPPPEPPQSNSTRARPWAQRGVVALLAVHFAVQLLVPLRSLAYPGHLPWHEQGFRFGWRVMLVEKTGMVELRVYQPSTGRSWHVDPRDELTDVQVKMMSTQPDMILTYAHHVAEGFAARGIAGVEVRADAWASLNGRPSQRLVDPTVDLAAEVDGLEPKRWIVPLARDLDP